MEKPVFFTIRDEGEKGISGMQPDPVDAPDGIVPIIVIMLSSNFR